jgi:hypothetical protein
MARRPVTCRSCGYTTTPVSGFCPRCLELLPVGPPFAAGPLLLGALAAVVLGVGLIAALNQTAPGAVSVQETRLPGSTSAAPPAATAPTGSPSATTTSAPAVTPAQPLPSASTVVPPAAGSGSPPAPTAAPTAAPLAPAPPGASPPPTAVLGVESLPSTATDGEVMP